MSEFDYKQRKVDDKDRFDKNFDEWLRRVRDRKLDELSRQSQELGLYGEVKSNNKGE